VSAGGLSRTQRDLAALDRRDDRLWRLGYEAGRRDARRPRKRLSWQAVCLLVMTACGVGDVVWAYRFWVAATFIVTVWGLVVWFWCGRDRAQRWLGRRWVFSGRF
jgi:hypothetical protein